MKNKNWGVKFGLIAFAILGFSLSFSSAVIFNLNVEGIKALSPTSIHDNMMTVHFAVNGNDFGGFFYFSNESGEEIEGEYEVGVSNDSYFDCGKQIRGFYYNAERGERLWPLDDQTWAGVSGIQGLATSGGIYTLCGSSKYIEELKACETTDKNYDVCVNEVKEKYPSDGFGYYGSLNQEYSGHYFNLTMGVNYDNYSANSTGFISIKSESKLAPTFIRINNKYPVGFVYDYNGGVGLAGCRFTSVDANSMKSLLRQVNNRSNGLIDVFEPEGTGIQYKGTLPVTCTGATMTTEDTLIKILIEGIVGLDNNSEQIKKFSSLGNSSDAKMQYFGTKSLSNIALMNYAAKKAESLCRGKWKPVGSNSSDKILCWDLGLGGLNEVDISNSNKTIIVKGNVDVKIKPNKDNIYDVFIDGGNLIIDESDAEKYVIGTDGFVSDNNVGITGFNVYSYLRERSYSEFTKCFNGGNCIQYEGEDGEVHEICDYQDLACSMFDFNGDGSIDLADQATIQGNNAMFDLGHWHDENFVLDQDFSSMASVIKGNFIVNGKVKGYNENNSPAEGEDPDITLKNKYFIYGKFTTKDTISELENVFSWRCENGFGTDGIFCPNFAGNPYRSAALVVIDQNYSSPLLGS